MNIKYNHQELIRHYKVSKNQKETAKFFNMGRTYLNKILRKNCIKDLNNKRGKNNSNWKGGIVFDGHGRKAIYCPDHPNPSFCKIYVYEYRLIIEKKLKRFLTKYEIVHHIDGNHTNNKISNLKVMSQAEHCKLHNLKGGNDKCYLIRKKKNLDQSHQLRK